MPQKKMIILGSESPHRRAVLDELHSELIYRVVAPEIDEKAIRHPDPVRLTMRLARAKGDAVAMKVSEPCVIITADQVVVYGGAIREKPRDIAEAYRFLQSYGPSEPVAHVTSVCITELIPGVAILQNVGCDTAYVVFDPIPDLAISEVLKRGNALKSAGAVVIEDPDIAPYVKGVWNGYGPSDARTSVMGLPRFLTLKMLHTYGAI